MVTTRHQVHREGKENEEGYTTATNCRQKKKGNQSEQHEAPRVNSRETAATQEIPKLIIPPTNGFTPPMDVADAVEEHSGVEKLALNFLHSGEVLITPRSIYICEQLTRKERKGKEGRTPTNRRKNNARRPAPLSATYVTFHDPETPEDPKSDEMHHEE